MKTFLTPDGITWIVRVDVCSIEEVRDRAGIDLLSIIDPEKDALSRLADPVTLAKVLWILCEEQARNHKPDAIQEKAFKRQLAGDLMDQAFQSLREEVLDFFPKDRRAMLKDYLAKVEALGEKILAEAKTDIGAMDPEKMFEKLRASILGASSGNSPESSESTQGDSPSAN